MALALVFPVIFHAVGLGSSFLPMFYPILVAGFLIAIPTALVVGIISPLVSALLTGMPPFYPPIVFIMMIEGFVLILIPGVLYRGWKINAWVTVLVTMAADRLVLLLSAAAISRLMDLPPLLLSTAAVLKGIPGVVIILIGVPPLIKKMESVLHTAGILIKEDPETETNEDDN